MRKTISNLWPLSAEWSLSAWRSRPLLERLKRLLCWLLKKRRGLVLGDLWKCRRRPADSAAIVPCFEALPRGYTEALCCSGLPSLSQCLLQASSCSRCSWRLPWSSLVLILFPCLCWTYFNSVWCVDMSCPSDIPVQIMFGIGTATVGAIVQFD